MQSADLQEADAVQARRKAEQDAERRSAQDAVAEEASIARSQVQGKVAASYFNANDSDDSDDSDNKA
jgi:hypothetical protein